MCLYECFFFCWTDSFNKATFGNNAAEEASEGNWCNQFAAAETCESKARLWTACEEFVKGGLWGRVCVGVGEGVWVGCEVEVGAGWSGSLLSAPAVRDVRLMKNKSSREYRFIIHWSPHSAFCAMVNMCPCLTAQCAASRSNALQCCCTCQILPELWRTTHLCGNVYFLQCTSKIIL